MRANAEQEDPTSRTRRIWLGSAAEIGQGAQTREPPCAVTIDLPDTRMDSTCE